MNQPELYCICGHYGVGKTNVAVSLALALKQKKERVTLLDFDVVNPYFRSADNVELLEKAGVETILPQYANSNVDIPVLPPQVASVFEREGCAVFDVGGDDSGAVALGGYRERFFACGYQLYIVINERRPSIEKVEDACAMIRDIERASGLTACGIINNTNLGRETDREVLEHSFGYAEAVCEASKLSLVCTTAFPEIVATFTGEECDRYRIRKIADVTRRIF